MPVWRNEIQLSAVFHNDAMTFEQRRDAIVQIIEGSGWADTTSDSYELERLLDDLACAGSIGEFDEYWGELYDLADTDRVWIGTR